MPDRGVQAKNAEQPRQAGTLTTGDDQPRQPDQVGGALDRPRGHADPPQVVEVLLHPALQVQHADPAGAGDRVHYQPRPASRCSLAMVATSSPAIGSPRFIETSSSCSGSLK